MIGRGYGYGYGDPELAMNTPLRSLGRREAPPTRLFPMNNGGMRSDHGSVSLWPDSWAHYKHAHRTSLSHSLCAVGKEKAVDDICWCEHSVDRCLAED